jgi:hypothetical protein
MRATSRRLKTGITCMQKEKLTVTRHTPPPKYSVTSSMTLSEHGIYWSSQATLLTEWSLPWWRVWNWVLTSSSWTAVWTALTKKIKNANLDTPALSGSRKIRVIRGPSLTILLHSWAYMDQGSACWKGLKYTEIWKNETDSSMFLLMKEYSNYDTV